MTYRDYIRAVTAGARHAGGALMLACFFLLSPDAARARQATPHAPETPQAPEAPAAPPALAPAGIQSPTPRAPRPAPVAPAAPAQAPAGPTPRPAAPRRAPLPVRPPREVVTVVHRLSGWKLLAWLAASGPPAVVLEELPTLSDSHTNIVAGYVYGGRSVVARLPQAEVELEAFDAPQTPPPFFAQAPFFALARGQAEPEPEYLLVTSEGKRFEAKLVGLDSSTGLALLEAGEPLLPPAPAGEEGDTEDPTVGQRVRFYAPTPAAAPPAPVAKAATPPPAQPDNYIYLNIDQKEGRLTRLVRAPSGNLSSVVVSASVSPEWVGAVAANELGEVVGIVSQSRAGETSVLPMTAVREACERMLKLRGTVPQPWFGARGDAAGLAPLDRWKDFGWPQEFARSFIEKSQGILLESVAPGTPAALAGLRPGDLITSVGPRDVRSNEDFSLTLKEAGVGSVVDLTVLRATTPAPLKFSVELKGVKNPARATAEAEERALRESLLGSEREIRELRLRSQSVEKRTAAELERVSRRLASAEERAARLREQLERTRELLGSAGLFSVESAPVLVRQPGVRQMAVTTRLKTFGLHAIGLSSRGAGPLGAKGGLLVVGVRPESPAAASGLQPGDVIETVNGSPFWRVELRQMTSTPEAAPAVFGLVRGGKRLNVNFQPAPAPEPRR